MAYNVTAIDTYEITEGINESQLVDISIVQRTMGTISMIGSIYVIQEVLKNEQKRNHTFHRLMVGLSLSDVLSSFFVHILSTSPMPKGYHVLAVGSVATCDVQGFINMMCAFVTPLYNCSLTTYYLVQLKYNWINRRIKALEKWLHVVPWSVGLVNAIIPLVFKAYGPGDFSCIGILGYPIECTDPDSTVECVRGSPNVYQYTYLSITAAIFLAIVYVCTTMFMVYRSVSRIEKQAHKYSFARYMSKKNDRKRSHRVMLQGVLYSLVLLLIYICAIAKNAVQATGRSAYIIRILFYTFWPLQGFFNALIYSIPVFQRLVSFRQSPKEGRNWMSFVKRQESASEVNLESSKNQNVSKISQNSIKEKSALFHFGNNVERNRGNNISSEQMSNDQQQSALDLVEIVEEEEKEEFDGEEEKKEIQSRNHFNVFYPGIINHEQSEEIAESYIIDDDNEDDDAHSNRTSDNMEIDDYLRLSLG